MKKQLLWAVSALLLTAGAVGFTACDDKEKTVAVENIELNKPTLELEEGLDETLTATVTPTDATATVVWESSKTDVATVDQQGKVFAVSEGTATITAKAGEKEAKCEVTVTAADALYSGKTGDLTWKVTEANALVIRGEGAMPNYKYEALWNSSEKKTDVTTDIPWYDYYADIKTLVIGQGVTTVGDNALRKCETLTDISLPAGLTTIGINAFGDCKALKGVSLPSTVTSLGEGVFAYCSSMTEVTLSDDLKTIGSSAFIGCFGLTEITLPAKLESIDGIAFSGDGSFAHPECTITKVTCLATTPPTLNPTNNFGAKDDVLSVPAASVDAYKAVEAWANAFTTIKAI